MPDLRLRLDVLADLEKLKALGGMDAAARQHQRELRLEILIPGRLLQSKEIRGVLPLEDDTALAGGLFHLIGNGIERIFSRDHPKHEESQKPQKLDFFELGVKQEKLINALLISKTKQTAARAAGGRFTNRFVPAPRGYQTVLPYGTSVAQSPELSGRTR